MKGDNVFKWIFCQYVAPAVKMRWRFDGLNLLATPVFILGWKLIENMQTRNMEDTQKTWKQKILSDTFQRWCAHLSHRQCILTHKIIFSPFRPLSIYKYLCLAHFFKYSKFLFIRYISFYLTSFFALIDSTSFDDAYKQFAFVS